MVLYGHVKTHASVVVGAGWDLRRDGRDQVMNNNKRLFSPMESGGVRRNPFKDARSPPNRRRAWAAGSTRGTRVRGAELANETVADIPTCAWPTGPVRLNGARRSPTFARKDRRLACATTMTDWEIQELQALSNRREPLMGPVASHGGTGRSQVQNESIRPHGAQWMQHLFAPPGQ